MIAETKRTAPSALNGAVFFEIGSLRRKVRDKSSAYCKKERAIFGHFYIPLGGFEKLERIL